MSEDNKVFWKMVAGALVWVVIMTGLTAGIRRLRPAPARPLAPLSAPNFAPSAAPAAPSGAEATPPARTVPAGAPARALADLAEADRIARGWRLAEGELDRCRAR